MRQLMTVMGMVVLLAAPAAGQLEPLDPVIGLVCDTLGCRDFCPATAFPATGQTTTHVAGDDGDIEAGATLSYTDNGDGTVTDNNTGLMWEKKTALDEVPSTTDLHDADNSYPWIGSCSVLGGECRTDLDCLTANCEAIGGVAGHTIFSWVAALNEAKFAGYSDWRLPNIKELHSIVDYGKSTDFVAAAPLIHAAFGPTGAGAYWSSTEIIEQPDDDGRNSYGVDFRVGDFSGEYLPTDLFVRAVRGGS